MTTFFAIWFGFMKFGAMVGAIGSILIILFSRGGGDSIQDCIKFFFMATIVAIVIFSVISVVWSFWLALLSILAAL